MSCNAAWAASFPLCTSVGPGVKLTRPLSVAEGFLSPVYHKRVC